MKFVGERRALAAAIMAFYFLFYGVIAYAQLIPEFTKAFAAIAGVYGLAFFALVAGYFWARWYAVGVGLYGVITAAVGIWQIGAEPVLLFIGGTHLAATVFLWGQAMSGPYDGQAAWREKFHMDESAVQRLGRSVILAGVSLPFILLYAFAPKPDGASMGLCLQIVTGGRIWRHPLEFGGNARRSGRCRPLCPHARLNPTISSRRRLPAWSRRCTEPSARARSCHAEQRGN